MTTQSCPASKWLPLKGAAVPNPLISYKTTKRVYVFFFYDRSMWKYLDDKGAAFGVFVCQCGSSKKAGSLATVRGHSVRWW